MAVNSSYPLYELDGTLHARSASDRRRTVCGLYITRYYKERADAGFVTCTACAEKRPYVSLQDAGIRPL